MTRCEDEKMREDVMMIRCDDRPPLLEEPFARTLSGRISILPQFLTIEPHFVRNGCDRHFKIAILRQFFTIEPHFVRNGCDRHFKIAILPQFLPIEPHFVRNGCDRHFQIAILLQFLTIEPHFVRKGCISWRLVGTAPRLKREIEKKEGEEGKRAREQEGKRERT